MKTIVMGKKIKRNYELISDLNEDNEFTSRLWLISRMLLLKKSLLKNFRIC